MTIEYPSPKPGWRIAFHLQACPLHENRAGLMVDMAFAAPGEPNQGIPAGKLETGFPDIVLIGETAAPAPA